MVGEHKGYNFHKKSSSNRAVNFPEYFYFPGTGIPETFRVFPGNFPGT